MRRWPLGWDSQPHCPRSEGKDTKLPECEKPSRLKAGQGRGTYGTSWGFFGAPPDPCAPGRGKTERCIVWCWGMQLGWDGAAVPGISPPGPVLSLGSWMGWGGKGREMEGNGKGKGRREAQLGLRSINSPTPGRKQPHLRPPPPTSSTSAPSPAAPLCSQFLSPSPVSSGAPRSSSSPELC